MPRKLNLICSALALAAVTGLAASLAHAEPEKTPLGGPKVAPREVPGDRGQFGEPRRDKKEGMVEIPHQMFMRVLNATLTGESVAAEYRLSADQEAKIKELSEGFEKKMREYRQAHAKEFAELRQKLGEMPGRPGPAGKGEKPGKGSDARRPDAKPDGEMTPAMSPEEREKLMEKARELRENEPKANDVRTQIWSVLNDAQKKAVQTRLDQVREEGLKRRAEAETQKRLQKQEAEGKQGKKVDREQLRERLKNLSPEERERVLKELQKRREQEGQKPARPPADQPK